MADETGAGVMTVRPLMAEEVTRVTAGTDLLSVAQRLAEADVGALIVADGDDVQGVVSERDLVRALAAGRDMAATVASDVAHTTLVWCDADATVAAVAEEMMEQYVRHVLVEESGQLVGIVSARDLLGVYVTDHSFDD